MGASNESLETFTLKVSIVLIVVSEEGMVSEPMG
jgi:hypothetical protein